MVRFHACAKHNGSFDLLSIMCYELEGNFIHIVIALNRHQHNVGIGRHATKPQRRATAGGNASGVGTMIALFGIGGESGD